MWKFGWWLSQWLISPLPHLCTPSLGLLELHKIFYYGSSLLPIHNPWVPLSCFQFVIQSTNLELVLVRKCWKYTDQCMKLKGWVIHQNQDHSEGVCKSLTISVLFFLFLILIFSENEGKWYSNEMNNLSIWSFFFWVEFLNVFQLSTNKFSYPELLRLFL